jgi:release factor glutamine methyltransferase
MSLSVKEILNIGQRRLQDAGVSDAALDSKLLYCFMTGITSGRLFIMYQNILQDGQCDEYFRLIDERASGKPLQYITGTQEFMGLEFDVNESVLIPRQDTETMVEDVISVIKDGALRGESLEGTGRQEWDILDLCTGSGAIGISLAKLLTGVKVNVTCSDVSKAALEVARKNAGKLGVSKNIKFAEGDMFAPFDGRFKKKKFDLIASNPPYIESDVIPTLQTEVRDHEPMSALDGGEDGLDFYRVIAREAGEFLKKRGILFLEIGCDQGNAVRELLTEAEGYSDVRCLKDLAGRDRIIYAVKAE